MADKNGGESEEEPRSIKKIDYDKYFEKTVKDKKKSAICLVCKKSNKSKIIMMANSGTTGLRKHLKSAHPNLAAELRIITEKENNGQRQIGDFVSTVSLAKFIFSLDFRR